VKGNQKHCNSSGGGNPEAPSSRAAGRACTDARTKKASGASFIDSAFWDPTCDQQIIQNCKNID
jgi:hypothetical protein